VGRLRRCRRDRLGATLLAQAGGGLYWLVPSALAAFIFGLANVWVLLIEILR
jgi:hypothetical protein